LAVGNRPAPIRRSDRSFREHASFLSQFRPRIARDNTFNAGICLREQRRAALHKKSWAVIDRPYSVGCATVGALYERPRCIFCAKPRIGNRLLEEKQTKRKPDWMHFYH